jgi:hypothetical protein
MSIYFHPTVSCNQLDRQQDSIDGFGIFFLLCSGSKRIHTTHSATGSPAFSTMSIATLGPILVIQ